MRPSNIVFKWTRLGKTLIQHVEYKIAGRAVLSILMMVGAAAPVFGQPDYIRDQSPAPKSAEEVEGALTEGFADVPRAPSLFPELRQKLKDFGPFFADSMLAIRPRTYFLTRDNSAENDLEAWAIGGALDYASGLWQDRLGVAATLYTSQRLHGPEDKDGTLLLKPIQESFTVLGEAYARLKLTEGTDLRAFRQTFDLPYLNTQDGRMVPNTFEAYIVLGHHTLPGFDFIAGHVREMKTRASDRFVSMSEAAGFEGTNDGLTTAGAHYSFGDGFVIGAINHYAWNFMNTFYAEANGQVNLFEQVPVSASLQYTDQRSVGDALGGRFATQTGGARLAVSYRNAILTLAGTLTDRNSDIRSPFGGRPSFLSIMINDFDRAGEAAWLIGASYHFDGVGLNGLSAFTNYAVGNTPETGSAASPDRREWDITVDYRPQSEPLNGFWLRLRRARVWEERPDNNNLVDYRIIISYRFQIL